MHCVYERSMRFDFDFYVDGVGSAQLDFLYGFSQLVVSVRRPAQNHVGLRGPPFRSAFRNSKKIH